MEGCEEGLELADQFHPRMEKEEACIFCLKVYLLVVPAKLQEKTFALIEQTATLWLFRNN